MDSACDAVPHTESRLLPASSVVSGLAHSGLRGWRLRNEDAVVAQLLGPSLACFAVLDGHGGQYCSRWGAEQLPQRLREAAGRVDAASDADEATELSRLLADAVQVGSAPCVRVCQPRDGALPWPCRLRAALARGPAGHAHPPTR